MDLQQLLKKSLSYEEYFSLIEKYAAQGKTTGEDKSEERINFTKLNLARMQRLHKTLEILTETKNAVQGISGKQFWFVITESWCGDAAQNVPVIKAMADLNPNIKLHILLRDENPEFMNRYLSDGARSIPKLVVFDANSGEELFVWGSRPAVAEALALELKNKGVDKATKGAEIQKWYNTDKGQSTQRELIMLLERKGIAA